MRQSKQGELMIKRSFFFIGLFLCCACNHSSTYPKNAPETPELTIVIVIDQFAYHFLPKLMPWLGYGIHDLFKQGVVYTNAYHPNGAPVTAVGHTGIGTGCLAKYHGIIDNDWIDDSGKKITAYDTEQPYALIPTLSKEFLAANTNNRSIAISLKGRAATGLVGNDAPAIWLVKNAFVTDAKQRMITDMVATFNANNALLQPHRLSWQLAYNDPRYYQFKNIDNYDYASAPSLIESSPISTADYSEEIRKLPITNQLVFDLALTYLQELYQISRPQGHTMLWLSLSTLDKIGHLYGPESKEAIDTIYHIDKQIQQFIRAVAAIVPANKTLYVLTGDHGVMPIPEILKQKYPQAKRILTTPIIKKINRLVHKKFGIKNAIISIEVPFAHLNQKSLKNCSTKKRSNITQFIIKELKKIPGVISVYETEQLASMTTQPDSPLRLLQNNILPGRSGQITILIDQYTLLTKHEKGTSHQSPYSFNTHVPLVIYWPGHFDHKTISQKIWVPQLHATLAKIFNIAPTACALPALPGLLSEPSPTKRVDSMAQSDQALTSCLQEAIAHA